MNQSERPTEAHLAELLEEARRELRSGMLDVEAWRRRYPELAEELLPLVKTVRDLDTAADDWKGNDLPATVTKSESCNTNPKPLPERIGRYQIQSRLGAGGMGDVYQALDPQLDRIVAVKVPRFNPQLDNTVARQRFLREARAAAKVRHPHVCPIYDVGEWQAEDNAAPVPYVVMAFVDGSSIAERLKQSGPWANPRDAVALVRQVAEALNAVHAHGLIHRDLKPGNILLASRERERPEAILTDFGLARPQNDGEHLTSEGVVVGTPAYMAVEQVSADASVLGPWTDLYSLGVVLYQMLTGRTPFQGADAMSLLYQIGNATPPLPTELRPDLDPKLSAIVQKMMAQKPADRYQSAREVIAALDGWLSVARLPEPRLSGSETAAEPLTKVRGSDRNRRRWPLVAAACLLLLIGGITVAPQIILHIKGPDGKETQVEIPSGTKAKVDDKGNVIVELPKAKPPEPVKRLGVVLDPLPLAINPGEPLSPSALVQKPATIKGLRSWTIAMRDPAAPADGLNRLAWSPDGKQLAVSCFGAGTHVYDNDSGRLIRVLVDSDAADVYGVSWSPDGRYFAVGCDDGVVRIWDVENGRLVGRLSGPRQAMISVAWSPDGARLAAGDKEGTLRVWDPRSPKPLLVLPGHEIEITALAWTPDGTRIACRSFKDVRVWDANGKELPRLVGHTSFVNGLAWASDGSRLASAAWDGTIRLWDPSSGKNLEAFEARCQFSGLAWTPDGQRLIAAATDNILRTWEVATGKQLASFPQSYRPYRPSSIALSPNGSTIGILGGDGIGLIDAVSGKLTRCIPTLPLPANTAVAWSPKGDRFAVAESGGDVALWDTHRVRRLRTLSTGAHFYELAWSPDGQRLATPGKGNAVLVWNTETGDRLQLDGHEAGVAAVAWSPDGKFLASGDKTIRIWDAATGKSIRTLTGHTAPINTLAWSPDSLQLVSGGDDLTSRLWDIATGKAIHVIRSNEIVYVVAWSPDGKTVATATGNGGLQWWDAASGQVVETLKGHHGHVRGAQWSPDGKRFASSTSFESGTCQIRVWDGHTAENLWTLTLPASQRPFRVVWSPDGSTLLANCWNGGLLFLTPDGKRRGSAVHLPHEQLLCLSPTGHYRGSPQIERQLVYVTLTEDGRQEVLKPAEFAKKYSWQNDPAKVQPLGDPGKEPVEVAGPILPKLGEPLSPVALVQKPAAVKGVRSWSVETHEHRGAINAAVYSPDGRFLATGSDDGSIRLWRAETGQLVQAIPGPGGAINELAWSPDSKQFASCGATGTLCVWETESGTLQRVVSLGSHWCRGLAWSPDGKTLASSTDTGGGEVVLVDAGSGTILERLAGGTYRVSWSPDSKTLVTGGNDGIVRIWDTDSAQLVRTIDRHGKRPVKGVAWSPDGKKLATGGLDGQVCLWDAATGEQVWSMKYADGIQANGLAWSPDGSRIAVPAVGGGATFRILDADSGRVLHDLGMPSQTLAASWSADSKNLAITTPANGAGKVWILDSRTSNQVRTIDGRDTDCGLAWSPDGKTLAVGMHHTVMLWDTETTKLNKTISARYHIPVSLAWSPDGQTLTTAHGDSNSIRLWQASSGKLLQTLKGHEALIEGLAWAPDGKSLASASYDGSVRLWEASSGTAIRTLRIHDGKFARVAWSPDSKRIAASSFPKAGSKHHLHIWDVATGKDAIPPLPLPSQGGHAVAWSPDGSSIAVGCWAKVALYDANTGKMLRTFPSSGYWTYSLAWSPDGQRLAGHNDSVFHVWHVATGKLLQTLAGHGGQVCSVAWSKDGWPVATGGLDRTVRFWDAGSGKLKSILVALDDDRHFILSPEGHFTGTPQIDRQLVVVVLTVDGRRETMTLTEFEQKYGWRNDAEKVKLR